MNKTINFHGHASQWVDAHKFKSTVESNACTPIV